MSSPEDDDRDTEQFDWFSRWGEGRFPGFFRGFDDMRREIEREFENAFKNIEVKTPKDLIKEYQTPEGGKAREYGSFIYGYSMTVGPDGKPKVREFGNVKSPFGSSKQGNFFRRPLISSEREPLVDVINTDKEVRVAVELPGVSKENIKINAYDNSLELSTTGTEARKYHEVLELPPETDVDTASSTYTNGILEITFKKKEQPKPTGKEIKIE